MLTPLMTRSFVASVTAAAVGAAAPVTAVAFAVAVTPAMLAELIALATAMPENVPLAKETPSVDEAPTLMPLICSAPAVSAAVAAVFVAVAL